MRYSIALTAVERLEQHLNAAFPQAWGNALRTSSLTKLFAAALKSIVSLARGNRTLCTALSW